MKENDFGETTKVAGKTVLMMYNLLLRANAELEVTDKIGAAIKNSVDNAKNGDSVRADIHLYHTTMGHCAHGVINESLRRKFSDRVCSADLHLLPFRASPKPGVGCGWRRQRRSSEEFPRTETHTA